ncbi:NAD/NADP-dependent betaine aldehyde dehydrogenase [Streptomyces tanashiensis]
MTDSQAPAAPTVPADADTTAEAARPAAPAGATNPVAPAPAGVRTAADVVTPELVARLTRGVVGSGRTANHTPFTGEKLADLPESTPEDVAEAFTRARAAQAAWAAIPVRTRAAVLLRFHDLVLQRQAEVLDLIQLETGKARLHAHEEVQAVAVAARHYGRKASSYLRAKRHTGVVPTLTKVTELRQPRGVVGQIAPWNYPLELSVGDALPAFVSGNAVVMKPDTETALTALWARDLLIEAGLPAEVFQVVLGEGPVVGPEVVAHADYVSFTGSTRMKDTGLLPRISGRLGELTRTNSEALVGSQTTDRRYRKRHGKDRVDFTKGVAITSSIHPDDNTHIEPVRYGKGSNSMGGMTVLQVPYGAHRVRKWLLELVKHPALAARSLSNRRWSERTIIGLVMQSLDNSLTTYRKPGGLGKGLLTARQGHGAPNPTQIEAATRAARLMAEEINGFAGSNIGELMGTPLTAHFLGGCPIGADAETGVIDPYHRLFGHPGISVVDGAAVSANLGVNPSLTITAQAERAMSFWPNKGEEDTRPRQGEAYVRLSAVEPKSPAVPPEAFGALRLPFLGMPAVPPKKD